MQQYDQGGVQIIEMLFSTNLLAIVGMGDDPTIFSRKRLTIWNSNNYAAICEISFPSKVNAVKFNKQRLVVCLKDNIHIYDLKDMRVLQSLDIKN